MSDISFSLIVRSLAYEYFQGHISFEQYRRQRKSFLDKIDEVFNERKLNEENIEISIDENKNQQKRSLP